MKAQLLIRPGELVFADIPKPVCLEDEVLIKIISSCICNGSDPSIFKGRHNQEFPIVFGHEACGRIVETGKNVMGYKIGDRVSWWCTMGAFAEYVSVAPAKVAMVKLPESVPDEEGPIFELVGAASRAMEAASIKKGSKILIVGLGPSGLIMSQIARSLGASQIMGWDLYEMRRELGLKLGCTNAFDNSKQNVALETLEQCGEFDIVIDAFGDDLLSGAPTMDNGVKVLKTGGTIISYGHPVKRRIIDVYEFQSKSLTMRGPVNDLETLRTCYEKALEYYNSGELDLKSLITGHTTLDKVEEALSLAVDFPDKNIKIIIDNC